MITEVVKIIVVLGLLGTKFMMGMGLIFTYAYGFWPSFILSFVGGMGGFFIFALFSNWFLEFSRKWRAKRKIPTFSTFNRTIVKIRGNYGLAGISLLTPIFLTVPLGTFMAITLKRRRRVVTLYMTIAFLLWSLIFTGSFSLFGINLQKLVMEFLGI